jgi:hypothetical protein
MVRLVKGNMVTLQKIRPNKNSPLLMVCLNVMLYLDFTSCLLNQRDVITTIALEHLCPALKRKQDTLSSLEMFANYPDM